VMKLAAGRETTIAIHISRDTNEALSLSVPDATPALKAVAEHQLLSVNSLTAGRQKSLGSRTPGL
jgi:hypothetical protein